MTEPHFPGYEVNLKHPLYKKIDSIIENINKNLGRTEIDKKLAIQFLEKPGYYLLSVHPILTFKNKIFDVHQKEIQSFITENFNIDRMEGKDIIILDKELIPILVGNHDGQIFLID
ncbi:hypothetical protein [Leptospira kirschneri]|uniref:hypothetical protein n=2 Tax=Leptospira kirschneri TaxID=29507 RepID=UPI000289860C|nr:hypothetical protein [Leptospira kirschneri]EMK18188.1 hypothetical protein LEP1GSC042_1939 [Leptospira kirschneri serovar Bim str. PUO 1247]EMN02969.1 hypothetical protein LEP1GSC046_0962 [Leptospira kirschneri serovar Bim str. 1051]EPG49316.1 hypothetical protein LEP1GSC049_0062 [Leptospira kirschneri serovar Cynopteri str. 3522 CT]